MYLIGMDLLKHGESAYPADAWVEQQYMKEDAIDVSFSFFRNLISTNLFIYYTGFNFEVCNIPQEIKCLHKNKMTLRIYSICRNGYKANKKLLKPRKLS